MGNLTDFFLAGHSFGGYIVGNYALKYHKHLKKILMLNPVGFRVKPAEEDPLQRYKVLNSHLSWYEDITYRTMWRNNIFPFAVTRILGPK